MYGLPDSVYIKKQLPKKAIYDKFGLKADRKSSFDNDISRIDIIGVVSSKTIPALSEGNEIKEFYILHIQMKRMEYSAGNIEMLSKLIPQNMVFVIQCGDCSQLAVFHSRLITSQWTKDCEIEIPIHGTIMDAVWENIVKHIGDIHVEDSYTLVEQINKNAEIEKIKKQIDSLKFKMAKTCQPRKKREYFEQIKQLKQLL